MAMTKCKECGHNVSTQAKSCPSCGAQLKGKTAGKVESVVKWSVAAIALVFALALAWAYVNDTPGSRYADDLNKQVEELERQREQQP